MALLSAAASGAGAVVAVADGSAAGSVAALRDPAEERDVPLPLREVRDVHQVVLRRVDGGLEGSYSSSSLSSSFSSFSGGGMRRRGSAGEEPAQAVPRLPEGALGLDPLEEADAVVLGGKPPLTLRGRAVRRFCSGGGEAGVELGAHQRVEVGLFFEREFFFSRR